MDKQQPSPSVLMLNYHELSNRAFERFFKIKGIVAESATTVEQALEMAAGKKYRLLICRYAVCLQEQADLIGEFWRRFGIPGMLLTGTLSREEAATRVLPEAFRGALIMPVNPDEMITMVRAALVRRCPDCKGEGAVMLLVSKKPCVTCGGTGSV